MLPLEHPDRIQIAFDDHRLVNNAGLLLPATLAGRLTRSARRLTLHLPKRWPWPGCEPFHSQPDCARPLLTRHPANRTPRQLAPAQSASASCRVLSRHLAYHSRCRPPANLPSTRIRARIIAPVTPSPPSAVLAPSIGEFGLN